MDEQILCISSATDTPRLYYIVNQLGIRYLWIDSICIIQDSAADWEIESSQMTDSYSGATKTIFADGAADDNAGMIRARAVTHASGLLSNDEGSFDRLVNRSLLSTRAWIFQERLCLAGFCTSLLNR